MRIVAIRGAGQFISDRQRCLLGRGEPVRLKGAVRDELALFVRDALGFQAHRLFGRRPLGPILSEFLVEGLAGTALPPAFAPRSSAPNGRSATGPCCRRSWHIRCPSSMRLPRPLVAAERGIWRLPVD